MVKKEITANLFLPIGGGSLIEVSDQHGNIPSRKQGLRILPSIPYVILLERG